MASNGISQIFYQIDTNQLEDFTAKFSELVTSSPTGFQLTVVCRAKNSSTSSYSYNLTPKQANNGWLLKFLSKDQAAAQDMERKITKALNHALVSGKTELESAIEKGKLDKVKKLLESGCELVSPNSNNQTPLMHALKRRHQVIALELIKYSPKSVLIAAIDYISLNAPDELLFALAERLDFNAQTTGGWTPLKGAVSENHYFLVKQLLAQNADPNITDKLEGECWAPLHNAAKIGDVKMILLLVKKGADINKKDAAGNTPLAQAVLHGNLSAVQLLIKKGADINSQNTLGETPLMLAAQESHLDMCDILCGYEELNVNIKNNKGNTALHIATENGDHHIVKLLLAYSPHINYNHESVSQVGTALSSGNPLVVLALLEYGIARKTTTLLTTACDKGKTPLQLTENKGDSVSLLVQAYHSDWQQRCSQAELPQPSIVAYVVCDYLKTHEILADIAARGDINKQDSEGYTLLGSAAKMGDLDKVDTLLNSGASTTAVDRWGFSPLKRACCARANADTGAKVTMQNRIIKRLIEQGADVHQADTRSDYSNPPLHTASEANKVLVVSQLLQQQANVDAVGGAGETPLTVACSAKKNNAALLLISQQANVNLANRVTQNTPLMLACQYGLESVVESLFNHGAAETLNNTNNAGQTALCLAAKNGHSSIVSYLLEQGADPFIESVSSPLDAAIKNGHSIVVLHLINHGVKMKNQDFLTRTNRAGLSPEQQAQQSQRKEIEQMLEQARIKLSIDEYEVLELDDDTTTTAELFQL
ncbi:MAG: ankyrin repeat domain-containing protein [Parashewanella sp.]